MSIRSPIRWVGGKQKLRKKILRLAPPIGMYTCYVEVFGGGAWVLFGKEPSLVEVLNDYDKELITFYRILKKDVHGLTKYILENPFVSRDEFDNFVEQDPKRLNRLERARRFFYLLMAGWGGEIDKVRFQTSITDLGGGNRLFGAIESLRMRLYPASERLQKVIIERLDWRDCIERYDSKKTFMFLDPPYPGNNVNYAHNMLLIEEHKELAIKLNMLKSKWLLTCFNTPEIRKLYADNYISSVKFASGMDGKNGRENSEIIVTNYDPNGLSKQYEKIERLTKTPRIALEDEALIIDGKFKDKKGMIDEFIDARAVIRIKKKNHNVPLRYVRISRSNLKSKLVEDKKIAQLRQRLSLNIDRKTLKKIIKMENKGIAAYPLEEATKRFSRCIEEMSSKYLPTK